MLHCFAAIRDEAVDVCFCVASKAVVVHCVAHRVKSTIEAAELFEKRFNVVQTIADAAIVQKQALTDSCA